MKFRHLVISLTAAIFAATQAPAFPSLGNALKKAQDATQAVRDTRSTAENAKQEANQVAKDVTPATSGTTTTAAPAPAKLTTTATTATVSGTTATTQTVNPALSTGGNDDTPEAFANRVADALNYSPADRDALVKNIVDTYNKVVANNKKSSRGNPDYTDAMAHEEAMHQIEYAMFYNKKFCAVPKSVYHHLDKSISVSQSTGK